MSDHEAHRDECIIATCHHHMLEETTVASGPREGFTRDEAGGWRGLYDGYSPGGGPEGPRTSVSSRCRRRRVPRMAESGEPRSDRGTWWQARP